MDPRTYEQQQPLIANLPQVPLIPQQLLPSGSRKDCIRLRGLPYEAQVEQILEFLGEHAKNIVFQGVHMVYNAQVIINSIIFGILINCNINLSFPNTNNLIIRVSHQVKHLFRWTQSNQLFKQLNKSIIVICFSVKSNDTSKCFNAQWMI